jgi:hypothetical protein
MSKKPVPNLNEPNEMDTPINKVRRFLEILRFKNNDLIKYKNDMDNSKMEIKILLDKYTNSQSTVELPGGSLCGQTTTIHTQQLLVDIHDNYESYKEIENNYIKTKRHVENIQRMINNINIRPYIDPVVQEFM